MGFRPCIDFFRKEKRIYLTSEGVNKFKNIKITGTKIPTFFKLKLFLPNEEEESISEIDEERGKNSPQTPYKIWSEVFHFPYVPKRNIKKQENYREMEEHIKKYLEVQFNKTWVNYALDRTDIFDSDELLGGVPDGEEFDKNKKVLSILEIKTITDIQNRKDDSRFQQVPISYQLQISLYLYLRGIDIGYICICYLEDKNWQSIKSIKFDSKLIQYSSNPIKFSGELHSWIEEIGVCEYEYELLEAYCNNFLDDNEILVFKIKVNLEKYKKLLDKLLNWFVTHQKISPKMTDQEMKSYIEKNCFW